MRQALKAIFEDTRRMCREDAELRGKTAEMVAGTKLYAGDEPPVPRSPRADSEPLTVEENTTFSCARRYALAGEKTAALNFANPVEPGGGVTRGAMAQEECLCRSSNLYEAFLRPDIMERYYLYHRQSRDDVFSDRLFYSPAVTVLKSDDALPVPLEEPFAVDVITCAAPIHRGEDAPDMEAVFVRRIRRVLEAALDQGAETLILGAWGCGAFGNPPTMVAEAFRKVLMDEAYGACFRRVVFAIKSTGPDCPNLRAFRQAFGAQG